VTTEPDTASEEPTAAEAEERWRPTRRFRIAALVLAVLLVAGITGGVIVMSHNESAPLDAVRAYVDAIARGDASGANAMVDPERLKQDVDPALLTDKVLGSAEERITIKDVHLDTDADPAADIVEVQVNYTLGEYEETVTLRAERTVATLGVLDNWRVIDPLLVPVQLDTNLPSFDTASLGGTATVPVGGEVDAGWPERRFFIYPGVYDLSGQKSRYLTTQAEDVVTHTDLSLRPPTVHYEVTPELVNEVLKRLTKHLNACVAAMPKVPGDCPRVLDAYADFATGVKLDGAPTVDYIGANQVEHGSDGKTEPPLQFSAGGYFSYSNEEGEWTRDRFNANGQIAVTPDDDLTVTFAQEP
jgi:hypothetical protein